MKSTSLNRRKRTLTPGTVLKRKRKSRPDKPPYAWAIARNVITAHPASDSSEYVAALCEGIDEHAGTWFVWRTYFTNNRYGRLTFGQFGPQAPITIDRWLNEQIQQRGWYSAVATNV